MSSPLLGLNPGAPSPIPPTIPKIINVGQDSPAIDTSITPLNTIVAQVQGAPWQVDWISSVLTKDMATVGHDASANPTLQQYKRINGVILKLQGDLNTTQDELTKRWTQRGSALTQGGFTANPGDGFFADAGQGRRGYYTVTSAKATSVFAETVFEVEFVLAFYQHDNPTRYNDIQTKTVATYVYHHDYARLGLNPVIAEPTYQSLLKLGTLETIMVDDYVRWFLSIEKGSIAVPAGMRSLYDPFIDKFLRFAVEATNYPMLMKARTFSLSEDAQAYALTLWDVLERRDERSLTYARKKFAVAETRQFYRFPHHRSLRFSRFEEIVYPLPVERIHEFMGNHGVFAEQSLITRTPETMELPVPVGPPQGVLLAPIKNVHDSGYYVFSQAFWEASAVDAQGQPLALSLLEKLTLDYLQGEPLQPDHLLWLAMQYPSWPLLERYYYMPVVLMLIRSMAIER